MPAEFEAIFEQLKTVLTKLSDGLDGIEIKPGEYALFGPVGPATLEAWRGKMKHPRVMVAWIKCGKSYVSYHLLGLYMNPKLTAQVPVDLSARMQGKSCFNFKKLDLSLLPMLEKLTKQSIVAMRRGGFVG